MRVRVSPCGPPSACAEEGQRAAATLAGAVSQLILGCRLGAFACYQHTGVPLLKLRCPRYRFLICLAAHHTPAPLVEFDRVSTLRRSVIAPGVDNLLQSSDRLTHLLIASALGAQLITAYDGGDPRRKSGTYDSAVGARFFCRFPPQLITALGSDPTTRASHASAPHWRNRVSNTACSCGVPR